MTLGPIASPFYDFVKPYSQEELTIFKAKKDTLKNPLGEQKNEAHIPEPTSACDPDKEREELIQLWMKQHNMSREAATAFVKDHMMF